MKKIYLLLGWLLLSGSLIAQQQTMHSIGFLGGQQNVRLSNQDSVQMNFNGGGVIVPDGFKTLLQDKVEALAGFPAMVSYFPIVFDDELFISKGYFSDYVQLQWNILSQQERIERIKIFRKTLGATGDSLLIATIAADNFTFRDEYAEKGVLYSYTLFAEGIADDLRIPGINIMEGVGFAFPFGTAAGRITYEGGTAVEGVQVLAETDGNLGGKSQSLNGTDAYLSVEHLHDHPELELREGFTVQLWTKYEGSGKGTLFSKGDQYELSYEPGTLSFAVNDGQVDLAYNHPTDQYFHVTAIYDPAIGLNLYVQENDFHVDSASAALPTQPSESLDDIYFGRNGMETNYYEGVIDELRVWNKPLDFDEAHANFSKYLTGSEEGLAGYWKLNTGVGDGFYDFSRQGFDFNENHGTVWRGDWSLDIPEKSQLAYRGVTDENGNYVVRGFPYETSGSQYTFTPIFEVHEFEPKQQLRFVGDGSSIHNGLDFDDVSSFPVSGTIRYHHSAFPVEGVSILIDGKAAVNEEGELITTNALGQFNVDVPIGAHSLRMSKTGHEFVDQGRFPTPEYDGHIPTYDYQKPLSGLEFIDSTLVKLVGKVVGGPIESEKPTGFGLPNNNIGEAQISITSEKGYDLTLADSTEVYDERDINSSTGFSTKFVSVFPDTETGEFVTYLPPEKYVVTGVTAGTYVFGNEHHVTLNLEQFFEQSSSHQELLKQELANGDEVPGFPPYNEAEYDYFTSEVILDTTYTYGWKDFEYEKERDFILRVTPEIEVVNKDGLELFGESSYNYEDELTEEAIDLIDAGDNYTFGHPVFFQQSRYQMFVSVFEEYENDDTGETDRVPVKDGKLEIENQFSTNTDEISLDLNESGKATYSFSAGSPSFTTNGAESFTKPFSLTAVTGEAGNIRTVWRESDPMRGIVFGGRPEGNNFVTTGPNQILTILRDPPGSNSRTYLEKGSEITTTVTWGSEITSQTDVNAKVSLGPDVEISKGIGIATTTEIDVTADLELGLEFTSQHTSSNTTENTITSTKTWSTSDDSRFVNSAGDVFVGHSTNIVYGAATTIMPVPIDSEECVPASACGTTEHAGYKLGQRSKLRLNPEFGTMFIFTQSQIENVLIPDLKSIRNSILSYSADPGSVVATDEVIYLSLVPPTDERYGSANYNQAVWGDDATIDVGDGPSYKILVPDAFDPDLVSDTIAYYNKQIQGWERTLEENERVKVNAQLSENISFDGGTSYTSVESVSSTSTSEFDFNVSINAKMATAVGLTVSGVGAEVNLSQSFQMGSNRGGGSSVANSTTYSYELADGESAGQTADFYSIDVKTPSDGYGPVFVSRAGVSSCPYEGEERTQYFEPGQHILNFATVQVEKPAISIVNPTVANVPSNREAELMIELKNESESGSGVYYVLSVDDQSNPDGAILSIDGSVLTGDGRTIFIPGGQTVRKILKVSKGTADVNDYENIELKLASGCDNNVFAAQSFSVYFQPGCSDINLTSPVDQWVVNTNTVPEATQNIVFDSYDLQNGQFKYVKFQYKATSSSQWLTNMIFYNSMQVTQAEFDAMDEPKAWIDDAGTTLYAWDMGSLPDRDYDIRVVSVCEIGPGETAETPSEIHSGTKDTKRPMVFGTPQPADGILSANDEIMIQFDEPIEDGLLTPFNFSVKGVLNTAEISHDASIYMDGVNDYVKIPAGLDLSDRSFTVEFWIQRDDISSEQVVYAKGYDASDALEIGFEADNRFFIDVAGQRMHSAATFTSQAWQHFAVVYDAASDQFTAIRNDQIIIDHQDAVGEVVGTGAIVIGKSIATSDRFLNANFHDFRIWSKTRQLGDIYADMSARLSGSEVGLVGYWPMDEVNGDNAFDLARFRHAMVFADWEVSPAGKSFAFDGVDDHLEINTGSVVITDEMDYTIEFWFNGNSGQANAVLFSSGKGDGTDEFNDPENSLSIGFDADGDLFFINNGERITVADQDYLDNNWHHVSFSLSRLTNVNVLVDGEQQASVPSGSFGGLSGATMWLGARGYKTNVVDKVFDQHFAGAIDEFRIWNSARSADQVDLNSNSKLSGDEIGLMAYYPFEYYEVVTGVKIMNETLNDQWLNPYGANAGLANATGGADFSDDRPNIKDARPVDKVDFDWVVNEDKIIITPGAAFEPLIEQTVLEISIRDVEDRYENRLASPQTWTAFIDRNQLKWGSDQLIAEKEVYEPYSFAVDIVNRGGTETNYSIDNLPLWLKTNDAVGVLEPNSLKEIVFEVDEGLNTGYYNEDIFLSSNLGYEEKLSIDLQVFSPAPDWNTNIHDFQYSMNLVAQVEIKGRVSSDLNDRVAAFVNDTLRGDASLQYLPEFDLYEVFLDIYSNTQSGEEVELRVWDADKGVEYRNALPNITYAANSLLGTPAAPEMIEAGDMVVQTLDLKPGWNWTSVNVTGSSLTDINSFMEDVIAEDGDQIKGKDRFDIFTEGFGWSGTLSSGGGFENGEMYLFNLENGGSIDVVGQQASATTSIDIVAGWNWLGFIPRFNMTLNEAFAYYNPSNGDLIKSQYAFAVYNENVGWIGSLNHLEPGEGYLFNSSSAGSLTFPESSFLSGGRTDYGNNLIVENDHFDPHQYAYTMTMVAELDESMDGEYLINVYHENQLRGMMLPLSIDEETNRYFVTIYGDVDGEELELEAWDIASGVSYPLNEKFTFSTNGNLGSVEHPIELTRTGQLGVRPTVDVLVYPNPFTDHVSLSIHRDGDVKPEIMLTDLGGRQVGDVEVDGDAQRWQSRISTENLKPGVYLIQVKVGEELESFKIIKNQ